LCYQDNRFNSFGKPKSKNFIVFLIRPILHCHIQTLIKAAKMSSNKITSRFNTTFRALQHRNYRLWFFGQGLSLIGTWMQSMAQQVLVYRLTGSASALGIVSFMQVIPLIPFGLWGGTLADRVPKRAVILITQTLMMTQAVILAVLTWTGIVEIWHVYLMAFLLGAAKAVDMPARQSFAVEMVEGKEDLTSAIGLNAAIHNGGRTLGPGWTGRGNYGGIDRFLLKWSQLSGCDTQPALDEKPAQGGFGEVRGSTCTRAYEGRYAVYIRTASPAGIDEPGCF
jgi:hypothetical protein